MKRYFLFLTLTIQSLRQGLHAPTASPPRLRLRQPQGGMCAARSGAARAGAEAVVVNLGNAEGFTRIECCVNAILHKQAGSLLRQQLTPPRAKNTTSTFRCFRPTVHRTIFSGGKGPPRGKSPLERLDGFGPPFAPLNFQAPKGHLGLLKIVGENIMESEYGVGIL